jgi:isoleucyl-tRNA synthetase
MPLAKKYFQSLGSMDVLKMAATWSWNKPVRINLAGDDLELGPEDVVIQVKASEHYAAAGDRTTVVALNTDLDDRLREEGLYRELLHRVQNLRKDLDVDYTQRIRLSIAGSERLRRIVSENQEHLMGETLCVELVHDGAPGWNGTERREFTVDDEEVTILLLRA